MSNMKLIDTKKSPMHLFSEKRLKKLILWVGLFGFLLGTSLYAQNSSAYGKYGNKRLTLEEYQFNIDREYIYGFDTLHFFMTLEEVKEELTKLGFDEGVTIDEFDSDIYSDPNSTRQDFVQYVPTVNKFRSFSILPSDMEVLLNKIVNKGLDTRFFHLSKRYKNDFKLVTVPASLEKRRPWDIRLSFFNRRLNGSNVYRLFAISVTYNGLKNQVRNFTEISEQTLTLSRNRIYEKYGSPSRKRSAVLGEKQEIRKFHETFQRYYKSEAYTYNLDEVKNYALPIQLNLSYIVLANKFGNFQISYVATDYMDELAPHFTSSQYKYEDVDLDESIDLKF